MKESVHYGSSRQVLRRFRHFRYLAAGLLWLGVQAQGQPKLTPTLSSTNELLLTWPVGDTNSVLEGSTDLLAIPSNWQPLPVTPDLIGEHFSVTAPLSEADGFFRLRAIPSPPAQVTPSALPANSVPRFADAISFLYSGPSAVQFGIASDTIVTQSAAVVLGRVLQKSDASPLAGVRITLLDHPELGYTFSRPDGGYDLAVNGGGQLTLRLQKPGWLEVQAPVSSAWQNYATVPDLFMMQADTTSTMASLGPS